MLSDLSPTAKKMLFAMAAVILGMLLLGLPVILFLYRFEGPLQYLAGLLVGGLLSAVKLVLLEKTLVKTVDMNDKDASNYAKLQFAVRYFFTIGVLVGVFLLRAYIGLIGTVLGILALQLAAYVVNILENRAEKKAVAEGRHTRVYREVPDEEQLDEDDGHPKKKKTMFSEWID